jgi:TonB family protein
VEARATAHIQPTVGAFDARRDGSSRQRAGESAVAVRLAGFTPSATRTLARAERADELRPGGFDRRAAPPPPPSSAPAPHDPIDIPVEITFKPSPEYTEAARALKIEGVVRLEVDFLASGEVRVVRVVDGLGHGLDEAAARAARQIRFRPARAGGVAVDLRTTLQITFRIL